MDNGALIGWQFRQRSGQLLAENHFVGVFCRCKWREGFGGEILFRPLTRASPPDQINRRVVRQSDEKGAFIANTVEQFTVAGELDKNVLEQIVRIGLVTGQVQEKGI